MLGQSMNAIQKPSDARVCRYGGAAVFRVCVCVCVCVCVWGGGGNHVCRPK